MWGEKSSGCSFSHGFSLECDGVGVVDQSVQNGVGQGGVADGFVPLFDGNLCCLFRRFRHLIPKEGAFARNTQTVSILYNQRLYGHVQPVGNQKGWILVPVIGHYDLAYFSFVMA